MIIKFFDTKKINLNNNRLVLFYGKNDGLKDQEIKNLTNNIGNLLVYEEEEILNNQNEFLESALNKSLFETKKIILIKRATDKIVNIIKDIKNRNFEDIALILDADNLEKKSKLRTYFEKDNKLICVAFYPENDQSLSKLAYNFLKERNLSVSQLIINSIVSKSSGNRKKLFNDLSKIESYSKNGKKINSEILMKLINLHEDYSISELIDNCLAKNINKTLKILNENNFSTEDCILITRTFLSKSKRILALSNDYQHNKNINLTISSVKPRIFWKDKEIVKQQLKNWKLSNAENLIYQASELELTIKQNSSNAINILSDFIIAKSNRVNS